MRIIKSDHDLWLLNMRAFIIKHWIHVKSTNFLALMQVFKERKYSCKSEFVWNVHKQGDPLVSILNMHELVETVHDRAIDFEIPRLTGNVHFPCNTWIYRECKVQNGLILWETLCNYLLACRLIFWNNLLLLMEQLNFTWLILKFPDLLWYTPQKQRLKIIWYASEV